MKPLPKQYDHKEREKYWQEHWAGSDIHHFRDDKPREQTFVIDTPPPTVSGVLHMGHIFSYTQADFVARYQRMTGKDVFYPMGFDDNGLPTERLVEKEKKVRGSAMPRAEFVALCREVVKDAEEEFRRLFKSAALSVDWRQEYQTISDEVVALSQASFLDLLKKGEAYRDFRPTYWDWVDQTAIAQAEIENREMPGVMYDLQFEMEDGSPLVIATTRPELLGACVAVMYHPEDPNAPKYKGKKAVTPLFGVKVRMIEDHAVDKEFGSGLVMCCTFGDDTDKEWWRTHDLPMRSIIMPEGKIFVLDGTVGDLRVNSEERDKFIAFARGVDGLSEQSNLTKENCINLSKAIETFNQIKGLKPKQAHNKIVELLAADHKIIGDPKKINHTVKCAERSGTPIEIIPTHQWFVRITDKKEELKARGAECQWHPEFMRIRLNQWIDGLKEDWCISRQRFFGVPFPVWYMHEKVGMDYVEEAAIPATASYDQLPVDPFGNDLPRGYKGKQSEKEKYTQDDWYIDEIGRKWIAAVEIATNKTVYFNPDKDVMDTWATSSISPQISAKAIDGDSPRYKKLFPADIRPQAHEIIRTWAFYTIVKAHLHENTVPWKNLMISGWCLAADKTKMSKSKGNVVTPVALIEEKGTDAVRYWASTSRLGADTAFSEDLLKIGRKLVTKLWNASNFASLNLAHLDGIPSTPIGDMKKGIVTDTLDLWILSRLSQCIKKATQEFDKFEYCDARMAIEDFFWNDFCDNYLELVKARAYNNQPSALYTLYHCLDGLLRLFAPFVPHITEELYSHIFDDRYEKTGSIHARGQWPRAEDYPYDARAELSGMACVDVLNIIRKAKSEAGVSIKFPVERVELFAKGGAGAPDWSHLEPLLNDLKAAASAGDIVSASNQDMPRVSEKGWFSAGVTLAAQADVKTGSV